MIIDGKPKSSYYKGKKKDNRQEKLIKAREERRRTLEKARELEELIKQLSE